MKKHRKQGNNTHLSEGDYQRNFQYSKKKIGMSNIPRIAFYYMFQILCFQNMHFPWFRILSYHLRAPHLGCKHGSNRPVPWHYSLSFPMCLVSILINASWFSHCGKTEPHRTFHNLCTDFKFGHVSYFSLFPTVAFSLCDVKISMFEDNGEEHPSSSSPSLVRWNKEGTHLGLHKHQGVSCPITSPHFLPTLWEEQQEVLVQNIRISPITESFVTLREGTEKHTQGALNNEISRTVWCLSTTPTLFPLFQIRIRIEGYILIQKHTVSGKPNNPKQMGKATTPIKPLLFRRFCQAEPEFWLQNKIKTLSDQWELSTWSTWCQEERLVNGRFPTEFGSKVKEHWKGH